MTVVEHLESPPMVGFFQQSCAVVSNRRVREGFHVLTLEGAQLAEAARPGQFVGVLIDSPEPAARAYEGPEEFLAAAAGRWPPEPHPIVRRPFSFHDCFPEAGQFQIHFQVVGAGTAALADARPGQQLDCLGPLGQPIELVEPEGSAVLVGGGIGVGPFPFMARALSARGVSLLALCGARDASLLPLSACRRGGIELPAGRLDGPLLGMPEFEALGVPSAYSVDVGAPLAFRGFVTELLDRALGLMGGRRPTVYACGPWPMMRATAAVARQRELPCWLLLEEFMGCGAGVCMSCVVPVGEPDAWHYERVCTSGPGFKAETVAW